MLGNQATLFKLQPLKMLTTLSFGLKPFCTWNGFPAVRKLVFRLCDADVVVVEVGSQAAQCR